jgi:predicted Zn-dependent protease
VLLADAQSKEKKFEQAALEYQTALGLKPKKPDDVKVKLARAQLGAGQRELAKATLGEVLKADPDHPEGKELLAEMEKAKSG